jgi:gamma-glutamylcyclotransferase (GGCT)/AIG2-like uncharacterized protein YtfP
LKFFAYGIFCRDSVGDQYRGWEYLGERRVLGYTIWGPSPAMARPLPAGKIEGSLWEVPAEDMWTYVDVIEGHPHWYRRQEVVTTNGEVVWMYVMQEPVERFPWSRHMGSRWR